MFLSLPWDLLPRLLVFLTSQDFLEELRQAPVSPPPSPRTWVSLVTSPVMCLWPDWPT